MEKGLVGHFFQTWDICCKSTKLYFRIRLGFYLLFTAFLPFYHFYFLWLSSNSPFFETTFFVLGFGILYLILDKSIIGRLWHFLAGFELLFTRRVLFQLSSVLFLGVGTTSRLKEWLLVPWRLSLTSPVLDLESEYVAPQSKTDTWIQSIRTLPKFENFWTWLSEVSNPWSLWLVDDVEHKYIFYYKQNQICGWESNPDQLRL